MDVVEQINNFKDFLEAHHHIELLESVRLGKKFITIDFTNLSSFNYKLASLLLDHPEEIIKAFELAVQEFDLPTDEVKDFKIRIVNLPETQKIRISEIRSSHIGKFITIDGLVRQKSDVRPQVTSAKFECPSCGNVLSVLQLESQFKEPTRCGCGRKGKFRMIGKELIDAQGMKLEEASDDLDGGEQPKRINVFLKNDLVSPLSDKKTNPGSKVKFCGFVKEVPITTRSGAQSTRFDLLVEANSVVSIDEDFGQIKISPEEEEEIKKLAADPKIYSLLLKSIVPSIYGHDRVKEALILQLMGGVKKVRSDGGKTKGDMHVLLIGDPGAGKSQMLVRFSRIAPKCRYVSGKGTSAAGLCVAPNSTILTGSGSMQRIDDLVKPRLDTNKEFRPGVWKTDNINDVKIQSLSHLLKIHSKNPKTVWKLKAPATVFQVTLESGKKIELTGNTQLFSIKNGNSSWKKSSKLKEGDYIATARTLEPGVKNKQFTVDLLSCDPVIHNIKPFVKTITTKLTKKYGTLRTAAQKLNISENSLYHNWVNEDARGNIKLKTLKKICEDVKIEWKNKIKEVSLYNGKNHLIPPTLTANFLYVVGLIAGDGDIRKTKSNSCVVRLSNTNEKIHQLFRNVLKTEFNLIFDVQKGNEQRPTATRTTSKILGEILLSLGVPFSPKSKNIIMSNKLLEFSNKFLAEYIAGLYDSDGSVCLRETGSNVIDLTTCSEQLAKQIQLVLLRYNIRATLRVRPPSTGRICGKLNKFVLEIRGLENFKRFYQNIPIKHPEKKAKLKQAVTKNTKEDTNKNIIPGAGELLKKELQKNKIALKEIGWHPNFSRKGLQKVLKKISFESETINNLKNLANSDVFWDKIKNIKEITPKYGYVYDLTVEESHNFVVDGVLVHNTASVVKDEFLQGWSLEAGALVLANKGFCLTEETEIQTPKGIKTIKNIHNDFLKGEEEVWSLDYETLEYKKTKVKDISKRKAKALCLKLVNGDQLNITKEHPVLIWDNGYQWKEAGKIKARDCILTKKFFPMNKEYPDIIDLINPDLFVKIDLNKSFPGIKKSQITKQRKIPKHRLEPKNKITIKDIQNICHTLNVPFNLIKKDIETKHLPLKVSTELGEFIGLILTDGNISKNKYTIRFYNKSEDILTRYIEIVKILFGINPSCYKKDCTQVFFSSEEVYKLLQAFGIEPNKSKKALNLNLIRQMPKEFAMAFFCNVINGDGSVSHRQSGGLIEVLAGNKATLEQIRKAIRPLGIISKVHQYTSQGWGTLKQRKDNYKLRITGLANFKLIDKKFLCKKKKEAMEKILQSKDYSITIPNTYELFKNLNAQIPHSEKKILYANSIKLANLKKMDLSLTVVETATKQLAEVNPAKYTKEVKLLKKIIKQEMTFIRVESKEELGEREVYNLEIDMDKEPNFIANFIPVHNCCIDELDKMTKEDRSAMHEALEQQSVTISKANIQATLRAETTVLAAANPKFGRFDPYELLAKQIDLPPSLINRFDLIFPIRDVPQKEMDDSKAEFILELHRGGLEKVSTEEMIETNLLKKYVAYARKTCVPKLTDEAIAEIKEYYVNLRNSGGDERGIQAIPISARQLEGLIRLSEASAKTRLSLTVTKEDAKRAIDLLHYCLSQIGMDPETGKIDIDRISSGLTASVRGKISTVKECIIELEGQVGKVIPMNDIIKVCEDKKIRREDVEDVIEKLKRSGDLFSPRRGFISRI